MKVKSSYNQIKYGRLRLGYEVKILALLETIGKFVGKVRRRFGRILARWLNLGNPSGGRKVVVEELDWWERAWLDELSLYNQKP